jgi:hypothetical protein
LASAFAFTLTADHRKWCIRLVEADVAMPHVGYFELVLWDAGYHAEKKLVFETAEKNEIVVKRLHKLRPAVKAILAHEGGNG